MGKETFRSEWVRCGKSCGGCPHGPYWYAYWREGGKLRKRYVGKTMPGWRAGPEPAPEGEPEHYEPDPPRPPKPGDEPHPDDAILNERTATFTVALRVLGLQPGVSLSEAKAAYRRLSFATHPDRNIGQSDKPFKRVQCAWEYVRTMLR